MRAVLGLVTVLFGTVPLVSGRAGAQQSWQPSSASAAAQAGAPPFGPVSGRQPLGAPGAVYPGTYYLRNRPGVGFYYASPGYPLNQAFTLPQPVAGGLFGMSAGGRQYLFWKSPSGYFYPWAHRAYYGMVPPVIVINQGVSSPAQPPLSVVFQDLSKYLNECQTNHKLSAADYEHLARRLKDLSGKEHSLRIAYEGRLDAGEEADLRRDLDMLGEEISRRVKE